MRVTGATRRCGFAACLLLALAGLVGCQDSPDSQQGGSCAAVEREDYPALQGVVDDVLADVAHTSLRVGSCEDTGQPGASVSAQIPGWTQRKVAIDHLTSRGWTEQPGRSTLVSPDRQYLASVILAKDPGEPPFIDVRVAMNLAK